MNYPLQLIQAAIVSVRLLSLGSNAMENGVLLDWIGWVRNLSSSNVTLVMIETL